MNKKGDISFMDVLIPVAIGLAILVIGFFLLRDKVSIPWKSMDNMCGPPGGGGRCACCYQEGNQVGMCPADLPRELYGDPSCPLDTKYCNLQGKEGKFCDNAAGWKEVKNQGAANVGQGTCCYKPVGT